MKLVREEISESDIERFINKIMKDSDSSCWEVNIANHNSFGHKRIWINGRYVGIHRLMYMLYNKLDSLPEDMEVCHICDNPGCVNPTHLFLTSKAGNQFDKKAKNRQAKGENNGAAILSNENAKLMRDLYNSGEFSLGFLANFFKVSKSTCFNVCSNKSKLWRSL
ncbi:MAG: HNH endonuclease [Gammaproteobacteria bacterium]|nr:HNH endonuclease [Gammaproteobacteria bacterium]